MTCIAVTGASGYVGRFIVKKLLASGHRVIELGRKAPNFEGSTEHIEFRQFSLGDDPVPDSLLNGIDVLVHAAFHHDPGKYRGGEGDDPDGFIKRNVNGTNAVFEAAKITGVSRVIFLSSRAVYGTQKPGRVLTEDTLPEPDSLYGQVKLEAENTLTALADDVFLPISIRATGVYGSPSKSHKHKWSDLFAQYLNGEEIKPRIGTEVHGDDLAAAIELLLYADAHALHNDGTQKLAIFNVSDILLDRHELLQTYAEISGKDDLPLPPKSDASAYNQMDCTRLLKLGWQPRGKLDLAGLTHHKD